MLAHCYIPSTPETEHVDLQSVTLFIKTKRDQEGSKPLQCHSVRRCQGFMSPKPTQVLEIQTAWILIFELQCTICWSFPKKSEGYVKCVTCSLRVLSPFSVFSPPSDTQISSQHFYKDLTEVLGQLRMCALQVLIFFTLLRRST